MQLPEDLLKAGPREERGDFETWEGYCSSGESTSPTYIELIPAHARPERPAVDMAHALPFATPAYPSPSHMHT